MIEIVNLIAAETERRLGQIIDKDKFYLTVQEVISREGEHRTFDELTIESYPNITYSRKLLSRYQSCLQRLNLSRNDRILDPIKLDVIDDVKCGLDRIEILNNLVLGRDDLRYGFDRSAYRSPYPDDKGILPTIVTNLFLKDNHLHIDCLTQKPEEFADKWSGSETIASGYYLSNGYFDRVHKLHQGRAFLLTYIKSLSAKGILTEGVRDDLPDIKQVEFIYKKHSLMSPLETMRRFLLDFYGISDNEKE